MTRKAAMPTTVTNPGNCRRHHSATDAAIPINK
jgi:hypothetical protein